MMKSFQNFFFATFLALFFLWNISAAALEPLSLAALTPATVLHNFKTVARFLNDDNAPMGARFIHEKTGFTFDVLLIPSVPQGFVWVRSFPTSDKGEPHTQEHLLLGKGNNGKYVANLEVMSLAQSSAYTEQWHTCYHMHTIAGPDVFFSVLKAQLGALLHPDYSDEEIRREVCNFGVAEDPATHALRLEEKGTVYNEMVSTYERPWSEMERQMGIMVYGDHHPLAYESGGLPSALRTLTPSDIRKFHAANYHLANMGMVGSFTPEYSLDSILMNMDDLLSSLRDEKPEHVMTEVDLPPPAASRAGLTKIVEFPDLNDRRPSPLEFTWPAARTLNTNEKLLIDFFIASIAGDATTNLYKMFIDTRSRVMDIGAQYVYGSVSDDQLHPVTIGFGDVDPSIVNEKKIDTIRKKILDEIARIGALKENSPELKEFNDRVKSRVIESRRGENKFVNSPPGFGFRNSGSGSAWMYRLNQLSTSGKFDLHVTMSDEHVFVDSLLAKKNNFWSDYISKWRLAAVPYAVAGKPSPALLRKEQDDRTARCNAETERLEKLYGIADADAAIKKYRDEYDRNTAVIDSVTALVPHPKFISNPPMTMDDNLKWKEEIMPPMTHEDTLVGADDLGKREHTHHVNMTTSVFDNMSGATLGLMEELNGVVPPAEEMYLSLLPELMTQVGVIENGVPVSYNEMQERLRNEILSLWANFEAGQYSNVGTYFVVHASGNTLEESKRAISWMNNVLYHPDWREENLPRIREVVDQSLSSLRNRMQSSEESWVRDPAEAYRKQTGHVYLAAESFLTKAFNAFRLKWILKDAPDGTGPELANYLEDLGTAARESDREGVQKLLAALQGDSSKEQTLPEFLRSYMKSFRDLSEKAKPVALDAIKDLGQMISGVPDASLAVDWYVLCSQIRSGLHQPAAEALQRLEDLRKRILKREYALLFFVGSQKSRSTLDENILSVVNALDTARTWNTIYPSDKNVPQLPVDDSRSIDQRLMGRTMNGPKPMFVGLVNPNTQSGVFVNKTYLDGLSFRINLPDSERIGEYRLRRFLASKLFSGHGSHSIFMKTWSAGLAYSNGLSSSATGNSLTYYAERCPELPQTISFVIDELKKAPHDPALAEYAIAQVFSDSRAAESFEQRGEGKAIARRNGDDGDDAQMLKFRNGILKLREQPHLADSLFALMPGVYGRVLPGYDKKYLDADWGTYFVIGNEKQMALYEAYLKSAVGENAVLYRLYPRDFWRTE